MYVTFTSADIDQTILLLINEQGYDRAAALLLEAHQNAANAGEIALASSLLAAYQICVTCNQHNQEREMHYQAYEDSIQHEQVLKQQLCNLLDILKAGQLPVQRRPGLRWSEDEKGSIWQRVHRLLTGDKKALWRKRPFTSITSFPSMQLNREGKVRETAVVPSKGSPTSTTITHLDRIPATKKTKLPHPSFTTNNHIKPNKPILVIYCLGVFQVYEDDHIIQDWSNGKGKSIFKYLVTHRHQPINKEVLMDIFWPNAAPNAARNNLNVAIYGLRQALRNGYPDFSHILFQGDAYLLNPEMNIWLDFETFERRLKLAKSLENQNRLKQAIDEFHAAEELYQGEFLMEDRYDDWLTGQRESLLDAYLSLLTRLSNYHFDIQNYATCITLCQKFLAIEPCGEATHRQLMRAYYHQNQHYLSLRQYHKCLESLKEELDVLPDSRTTQLYQSIRLHRPLAS
jgi:DNA-binding SARP family transcriptional activator